MTFQWDDDFGLLYSYMYLNKKYDIFHDYSKTNQDIIIKLGTYVPWDQACKHWCHVNSLIM